jgi:K+-transporting ATPase ATPase C chain
MKHTFISSALAVVVFTVLLGLAYPLVITGVAQVTFGAKADGDPTLLAQARTKPVLGTDGQPQQDEDGNELTEPDPAFFQPRPSQTDYNARGTFFSNRGPNQAGARFFYRDQLAAYRKLNGPYNPGLTKARVPADAVTTSGSGVDPHISLANARIQARRVAAVRDLPLEEVEALVDDNTDGRFLGLLGEPGVNTTMLNQALDDR